MATRHGDRPPPKKGKRRGDWITAQRETNVRLGRIEKTLETSSKVFALMHDRLERLEEGQQALVEGQQALVEGQHSLVRGQEVLVQGQHELVVGQKALIEGQHMIVDRLDRLVEAPVRDRTAWAERFDDLERRVSVLEEHDRERTPPET